MLNQPKRLLTGVVIVGSLALVSCEPHPSHVRVTESDSSGVAIVVSPALALGGAPARSAFDISNRLAFAPGESLPLNWHGVSGVQIVDSQRVVVTSDDAKQLLWTHRDVGVVRRTGRIGSGPGEFQTISLVRSTTGTSATAFDVFQRRLTSFTLTDSSPRLWPLSPALPAGSRPVFRFRNGDLLVRTFGPRPPATPRGVTREREYVRRIDTLGAVRADLGWHAAADRVLRDVGNGHLTGGEPPFGRQLLVSANDSIIVLASTGAFHFDEYDARGQLRRRVRVDGANRPVNESIRRRYRERVLSAVTDEYGKREWTMLSADDVFPRELPAFDALVVEPTGDVWVRRTPVPDSDDRAEWVVFHAGRPIYRVMLPVGLTVYDVRDGLIAGVLRSDDGTETIALMRLPAS